MDAVDGRCRLKPVHDDYTTKFQADGFSVSAGACLGVCVNPALAWLPAMNGRDFENGLAFRTSVVIRMGTW